MCFSDPSAKNLEVEFKNWIIIDNLIDNLDAANAAEDYLKRELKYFEKITV